MKTTYVLGAGASRHIGYPFAQDMGKELFKWMGEHRDSPIDYPGAVKLTEQLFGETEDFEGLLTILQKCIEEFEDGTAEQRQIRTLIGNSILPPLTHAIREWFGEIQRRPSEPYRTFARRVVTQGDFIVTFNYDVSLDSELRSSGNWHLGDGYGFPVEGFPEGSPVVLFKLHGSTNWLAPLFGGRRGASAVGNSGALGARPVIPDNEIEYLGYQGVVDKAFPRCGTPALPVMILPTRAKEFFFDTNLGREWEDFWDCLWEKAGDALEQSDRVCICGYSLQTVDQRAFQLLTTRGRKDSEVQVCCGGDTRRVADLFRGLGYKQTFEAAPRLFEEWVAAKTAA